MPHSLNIHLQHLIVNSIFNLYIKISIFKTFIHHLGDVSKFPTIHFTDLLTSNLALVYEKVVDISHDGTSLSIDFGDFTNGMITAEAEIRLNDYGLITTLFQRFPIRIARSIVVDIPRKSIGKVVEIYARTDDANKGGMLLAIQ